MSQNSKTNRSQNPEALQCLRDFIVVNLESVNEEVLLEVRRIIEDSIKPRPVGVLLELHTRKCAHSKCYCALSIKMSDGSLVPVSMCRQDMVLYVCLLLHPNGISRSMCCQENDEMDVLFSRLYNLPRAMRKIPAEDKLPQIITNSRTAIKKALGDNASSRCLMIDSENPSFKNKLVIPFVVNGGQVEMINFSF